jgi:hypothetical protein
MALTRTLLMNHWISASVALEALDRYVETRVPLGRLALAEGLLKLGPLLHILDEQLGEASVGDSRRFGEIAVKLGYLDELQVEALLAAQAELSPSFEQILIDIGAFEGVTQERDDALFREDRSRWSRLAPSADVSPASPSSGEPRSRLSASEPAREQG